MNDIFHVMKIFRKTVLFAKNFYLQQELRGIMEVARSRGWQLELPQMYGLPGHVRNWHGAGLLTDTGYYTEKLRNEGVKIVGLSLDPVLLRTAGAVVAPDNARIGVAAAEYFLRHGYRRFAVCEDCFGRDLAFERRIAAEGVHAVRISMPRYFRSTLALKRVMERLSLLPTPCCIFCNNDWEASSVLNAAGMAGIKVPEHLAVLGVGNEELICSTASPQISSLDTRLYERGRRAAEELDRLMEGGDPRSSPILIPPGEVVERGSSSFYAVSNRTLGRILAFLRKRAVSPLQISALARRFRLSESTLYRLFYAELGISPKEFLTELRLEQARTRLRDTDDTIATIAAECGFSSACSLFELFRARYGCTPGRWRAANR